MDDKCENDESESVNEENNLQVVKPVRISVMWKFGSRVTKNQYYSNSACFKNVNILKNSL